jgi:hypothetical protein
MVGCGTSFTVDYLLDIAYDIYRFFFNFNEVGYLSPSLLAWFLATSASL